MAGKKEELDFVYSEEEKKTKTALEAKLGVDCYLVKAAGFDVWFKGPQEEEVDLFMAEQLDDKTKGSAMLDMARRNMITPDGSPGEPSKVFKRRPGVIVPISQAYARAVGLTIDAYLGK